jgi:hypothetical protein
MDRAADAGVVWRRDIRQRLDLGIQWLDPTRKPIDIGVEDDASRAARKNHKVSEDYQFVVEEMKPIRRVDLRMVDVCDFLIVNLDMDIHACGTYEEIFLANRQKKPIFIHVEQGKQAAPDWLYGTLPHEYFHSTWESLHQHVERVAHNPNFIDPYGRWYFFDWMGCNEEEERLDRLTAEINMYSAKLVVLMNQDISARSSLEIKRVMSRINGLCEAKKDGRSFAEWNVGPEDE